MNFYWKGDSSILALFKGILSVTLLIMFLSLSYNDSSAKSLKNSEKLEQSGDKYSALKLGKFYEKEGRYDVALYYFTKACEKGVSEGCSGRDRIINEVNTKVDEITGVSLNNKSRASINIFRSITQKVILQLQWLLTPENDLIALELAAQNGNVQAQFLVAERYANSKNAEKTRQAVYRYTRIAQKGYLQAWGKLAKLYCKGIGVDKNVLIGRELLSRAVEKDPSTTYLMADAYLYGTCGEKDPKKARDLLVRAAAMDYPSAIWRLELLDTGNITWCPESDDECSSAQLITELDREIRHYSR